MPTKPSPPIPLAMNLKPDQLGQHLNGGLKPVYLVSGDEPLLTDEACGLIRNASKTAGYIEREVFTVDAQFKWDELLASGNALSLFAEKKLIELRITNGKPGDKGSKALQAFLASQSDDQILLVTTPKLDKATQRSKWYKALDDHGAVVTVWPLFSNQLPRWIGQRLNQAGLQAEPDAVQLLAELVDGNLLAASQEIEKLKLAVDTGSTVSAEQIKNSVSNSSRFNVFDLVDSALLGDTAKALKILNGLKSEGIEAIRVLWALSREVRQLAGIAAEVASGQSPQQAMQNQRIWKNRQTLVGKALNRLKPRRLNNLLRRCGYVDRLVKGVGTGNPWDELARIVIGMAGRKA